MYLLGSTVSPQKMVLQIKNRQHGTQHICCKNEEEDDFFFFGFVSVQCQSAVRTFVSTAL